MKRSDAIAIIEREQNKGHFEPELDTAISIALYALKSRGRCVAAAVSGSQTRM